MPDRFAFTSTARLCLLLIGLLMMALGGSAGAGLSEADRITLDQPACVQMKTYSQDITLLNDEMQNLKRAPSHRRFCDVTGRAVLTIGNTVDYMRSHIGECTITADSTSQLAVLGRGIASDRGRTCR